MALSQISLAVPVHFQEPALEYANINEAPTNNT